MKRLSAQSTKIADRSAYGTDWSLERCMRQQLASSHARLLFRQTDVPLTSPRAAIGDLEGALCTATIKLPGQPLGVVLSTNGRRAFVSQFAGDYIDGIYSSGTIAVVDLVRRSVIKKIPVKPFPFALAFDAKRRKLYVTHFFARDGVGFWFCQCNRLARSLRYQLAGDLVFRFHPKPNASRFRCERMGKSR